MRKLGIDYGDSRVGVAITDALGITVQGLETIHHKGNNKIVLKRLEELLNEYEVDTIVVGLPLNMNGTKTERVEVTEKFIHKLKCKFNKLKIEEIEEDAEASTEEEKTNLEKTVDVESNPQIESEDSKKEEE